MGPSLLPQVSRTKAFALQKSILLSMLAQPRLHCAYLFFIYPDRSPNSFKLSIAVAITIDDCAIIIV